MGGRRDHLSADRLVPRIRDWDWVQRAAAAHRIQPHLHALLEPNRSTPHQVVDSLRQAMSVSSQRNLLLTGHLHSTVRLLESHGIQCFTMKGPELAIRAHGDLCLRQFDDVDLVVRPEDAYRSRELLVKAGWLYLSEKCEPEDVVGTERAIHFRFTRPGLPGLLELHWCLAEPLVALRVRPSHLLARVERVSVAGSSLPVLSVEDELAMLCFHGAKHCWSRLIWVADIARLLDRSGQAVDWEAVRRSAALMGGSRNLAVGVALAVQLAGATPVAAAPTLDAVGQQQVEWVCRRISTDREPDPTEEEWLGYTLKARTAFPERVEIAWWVARANWDSRWRFPLTACVAVVEWALRPLRRLVRLTLAPSRPRG